MVGGFRRFGDLGSGFKGFRVHVVPGSWGDDRAWKGV